MLEPPISHSTSDSQVHFHEPKNHHYLQLPCGQTEHSYESFTKRTKLFPVPSDFLKNNAPHQPWGYALVITLYM